MCRLNVIDIDKFTRRVNGNLKTLRTHRPLREVIIQVMRGQTATPWGPRKGNLEQAIQDQERIGNEKLWL